jgi:hypothetical protein
MILLVIIGIVTASPLSTIPLLTLAEFQSMEPLDFGTVNVGKSSTVSFGIYHPGILPIDVAIFNVPADTFTMNWQSTQNTASTGSEIIACHFMIHLLPILTE